MEKVVLIGVAMFATGLVYWMIFRISVRKHAEALCELQTRMRRAYAVLSDEYERVTDLRSRYEMEFRQTMPLEDFYLLFRQLVQCGRCECRSLGMNWEEGVRREVFMYRKATPEKRDHMS